LSEWLLYYLLDRKVALGVCLSYACCIILGVLKFCGWKNLRKCLGDGALRVSDCPTTALSGVASFSFSVPTRNTSLNTLRLAVYSSYAGLLGSLVFGVIVL